MTPWSKLGAELTLQPHCHLKHISHVFPLQAGSPRRAADMPIPTKLLGLEPLDQKTQVQSPAHKWEPVDEFGSDSLRAGGTPEWMVIHAYT